MRYLTKINKISTYYNIQDGLYCFSTESTLTKYKGEEKRWELVSLPTQHYLLGETENELYCYWEFKNLIKIKKGIIVYQIYSQFKPLKLIGNDIYGVFIKDNIFYFGYISSELAYKEIIVCTNKSIAIKILDDLIICQEGNFLISCYSLFTKCKLWEYQAESPIRGAILECNNLIVVGTKDFKIRGFEKGTGAMLWVCENVDSVNFFSSEDKIFCLSGENYKMINFETGNVIVDKSINIHSKFGPIFFQIGPTCFDGEKIYFSGQNSSIIGAFNLNTLGIDWLYQFRKNENTFSTYFLHSPEYNLGKVYVLDSDNTLHIFEK